MLAFRGGDDRAFDALFERWAGRVLRFVERMVREPGVAEDLVQETFLRVWRARERYRPEARFSTWLFTPAGYARIKVASNIAGYAALGNRNSQSTIGAVVRRINHSLRN
jgi:RNA polymerase sigma factor (sigma-70 family)